MPRTMAAHGRRNTRYPPPPGPTSSPCSLKTAASTPGNGFVAEPGFVVVMPGSGVIRIIPVSVCHHVSTTGVRPPPIWRRDPSPPPRVVGSPGHPADVGRAPVHRVGLHVEDVVVRRRDPDEVAGGRVRDPLRLRGRSARVQEIEEVLG